MTKTSIGFLSFAVVAGIFGTAAFFGHSPFLKVIVQQFGTTSGNAATAKISEFAFNPTTGATTTSSLVNSDGQDRVITSVTISCSSVGTSLTPLTGAGLKNLAFSIATTSASAPAGFSNTNLVYAGVIATSSPTFYEASSTPGTATASQVDPSRRWANNTSLTVAANATNTANCIISVSYLQGLGI